MPSLDAAVPVACGLVRSRLADQVGRVVGGRYRLLAPVGTGASADVYVADDVTLRRRVAVKILHDGLAGDEGFLRRFRAEARAAASLAHPAIVTVYDWGEEQDGPYLVLEYLGGGSLRDALDRGVRLTPSQAATVGLQAAHGLDYAHRRGLVHRDIKPANLLFDDEGRLAIADFGIARALAEATWTEPAGAVVGTARYASPEQARGESLDGRADVYALALVLIEAVTGSVPFAADTTLATLVARLDRPIPAPAGLGPLAMVVERCGTVEPEGRCDAAGMIGVLDEAMAVLPPPDAFRLSAVRQLPVPHDQLDTTTTFAPAPVAPEVVRGPTVGEAMVAGVAAAASVGPTATGGSAAGVGGPATGVVEPPTEPPTRRPSRPRRRWRVALLVVVAAGAVGAGVFFVHRAMNPTYPVPALTNLNVHDAAARARPHFTVIVHDERVTGAPRGVVLRQQPSPGGHRRGGAITVDVSVGNALVGVPDLAGAPVAAATSELRAAGLSIHVASAKFSDTVPSGSVLEWSPRTQAAVGDVVTVVPSQGPEFVTMPDLVTVPTTAGQATQQLEAIGIPAAGITQQQAFSDSVPQGDVIATAPAAGQRADRAGTVTLDVSKGPDLVPVPDVRGKSLDAADAALQRAGFVPEAYGPGGDSIVVDQRPPPGTLAKRGSAVLFVAL
jgi:serine/threonine-protein kinase